MNRKEFMDRLEKLLWNVSDSEREEALQYYNDYFDDAGIENEERVLKDLGSPEQVAAKIKAGMSDAASEFSEKGYEDARFRDSREVIPGKGERRREEAEPGRRERKSGGYGWKLLALVLLFILCSPVIVPVCGAVLAVIVSLVLGAAALCLGIVISGVAVTLAGIVVIGFGVAGFFTAPAVGLAASGAGCLILSLGILLFLFTLWFCTRVLPWLIRGLVALLRYPFRKAGA